MVLIVFPCLKAFQHYYLIRDELNYHNLIYFLIGVCFFAIIRVKILLKSGSLETLEHEITHVLFALLTLHPVEKLEVNEGGGGYMVYRGKGNWLIAISPYFVPLTALTMMFFFIAISRILGYTPEWLFIGLGAAFAYNLFSFAEQLHPKQTDFKKAGYIFTIFFIPGANLVMFGTIFAFVERGFAGILFFFQLLYFYFNQTIATLIQLF